VSEFTQVNPGFGVAQAARTKLKGNSKRRSPFAWGASGLRRYGVHRHGVATRPERAGLRMCKDRADISINANRNDLIAPLNEGW